MKHVGELAFDQKIYSVYTINITEANFSTLHNKTSPIKYLCICNMCYFLVVLVVLYIIYSVVVVRYYASRDGAWSFTLNVYLFDLLQRT